MGAERFALPPERSPAYGRLVARLLEELHGNRLLVLPAEGLYGLHAGTERARRDLVDLKGDRSNKPFIILLADPQQARRYVTDLPAKIYARLARLWPAPLTLVLPARRDLASAWVLDGCVALRCPDSRLLRTLAAGCEGPLFSTSANRAGGAAPARVADLDQDILSAAACVVEAGDLPGQGSTVARVEPDGGLSVLRPGLWVPGPGD